MWRKGRLRQGRRQEVVFLLLGRANHANLYKSLIKFQISNVNLGTTGEARPLFAPLSMFAPLSTPLGLGEKDGEEMEWAQGRAGTLGLKK